MDRALSFFKTSTTQTFLNPRLSESVQKNILQATRSQNLAEHVWLMSSGTESASRDKIKLVALSQKALLAAAEGVCQHFAITSQDIYLNALPVFHISGLSVAARAFVSGCQVVALPEMQWDVDNFVQRVESRKITRVSLVPTQIYDLVRAQKKSPSNLKTVFVGGGALGAELFESARALGWPLVLTYGMTETCAMLASSESPEHGYKKLPHLTDWKTDHEQRLQFLSPALLTGYLFVSSEGQSEWRDPKKQGWYHCDDRGEIKDQHLYLLGRDSEFVKINGESVSLRDLQSRWDLFAAQQISSERSYIVAVPHERHGFELVLVAQIEVPRATVEAFNNSLLPFQRLKKLYRFQEIPLSPLGKLQRAQILSQLGSQAPEQVF